MLLTLPTQRVRPHDLLLNRDHPIGRHVVFCAAPGLGRLDDLVSGRIATIEADHTRDVATAIGTGIRKDTANSSNGVYWSNLGALRLVTRDFTIVVWARLTSLASAFTTLLSFPYALGSWSSPYRSLGFTAGAGNEGGIQYASAGPTQNDSGTVSSFYLADSTLHCYVAVREQGNAYFYRDGVRIGATTFSTNADVLWNALEANLFLSSQSANISGGPAGTCPLVCVVAKACSQAEVARITSEPWTFLDPTVALFPAVFIPTAGAQSLTGNTISAPISVQAGALVGGGAAIAGNTINAPMSVQGGALVAGNANLAGNTVDAPMAVQTGALVAGNVALAGNTLDAPIAVVNGAFQAGNATLGGTTLDAPMVVVNGALDATGAQSLAGNILNAPLVVVSGAFAGGNATLAGSTLDAPFVVVAGGLAAGAQTIAGSTLAAPITVSPGAFAPGTGPMAGTTIAAGLTVVQGGLAGVSTTMAGNTITANFVVVQGALVVPSEDAGRTVGVAGVLVLYHPARGVLDTKSVAGIV